MATTATSTYAVREFVADARTTIKEKGVPHGLAEIRGHAFAPGDIHSGNPS
jgi:hypothetical protein